MLAYAFYENDSRILQYVSALRQRGDEVEVVSLRRKDQPRHGIVDGVHVFRIQTRSRNERGVFAYAFKISLFLVFAGVFIAWRHLKRRYQLIHVHSVPDFLVFSALVPKLTGARVILDIHDVLPELYASKFNASKGSKLFKFMVLIERISAAFSDYVIVANHIWSERLIERSTRRDKCTAICNYPNPQVFFPRPRKRSDGKFIMIFPGTLEEHQGVAVAVKAFAKATARMPDAEFHVYGEGPSRRPLEDLAHQLGLDGKVVFHDFLPLMEIAGIMGQSDLGVEPKLSAGFADEAVSTKVLEYMALGIPVTASRTKAASYYHDDSRIKYYEPGNDTELAECMMELHRDPLQRERLVANSALYVRENNWGKRKSEYLDVVDFLTRPRRSETQSARTAC